MRSTSDGQPWGLRGRFDSSTRISFDISRG